MLREYTLSGLFEARVELGDAARRYEEIDGLVLAAWFDWAWLAQRDADQDGGDRAAANDLLIRCGETGKPVTGYSIRKFKNAVWRLDYRWPVTAWTEYLRHIQQSENEAQRIRSRSRIGRPLGSESFVRELERLTGRRLRPFKVGRKPKREWVSCHRISQALRFDSNGTSLGASASSRSDSATAGGKRRHGTREARSLSSR